MRGTLPELLVYGAASLGIVGFLFGSMWQASYNWTGAHKARAEANAKAWSRQMGIGASTFQCVRKDTDGDGYVSCTFVMPDQSIRTMECAGEHFWVRNEGCREPKLRIPRGGY